MGWAAQWRAPARVVLFVFVVVNALRVVVVGCVDDLHGTESLKTRPGSMSESPALARYGDSRGLLGDSEDCREALRPLGNGLGNLGQDFAFFDVGIFAIPRRLTEASDVGILPGDSGQP